MRLIPVDTETSIPTMLMCADCHAWRNSGELYADLDGTPFQAYYCRTDQHRLGGLIIEACANKHINVGAEVLAR